MNERDERQLCFPWVEQASTSEVNAKKEDMPEKKTFFGAGSTASALLREELATRLWIGYWKTVTLPPGVMFIARRPGGLS